MNLSTARFTGRAKEVGIRKTLGADRGRLIRQFIGESVLMAALAMNLALLILELYMPLAQLQWGVDLFIPYQETDFVLLCIGLVLATGIISGSYPAFILSSFSPVKVLKNPAFHGFRGFKLRKALVVFQFVIAVVFILSSVFVMQQYKHMHDFDRGFRTEGMLYFATKGNLYHNYPNFRNEILGLPGVQNVTTTHSNPKYISLGEFEWGLSDEKQKSLAHVCWTGLGFPETFEIEMLEGRFYDQPCDSTGPNEIVINKRLAEYLGLETAVGNTFYLYHERYKIIGVIDDFEFFPFAMSTQMLILPFEQVTNNIFVALSEQNRENTIAAIEEIYKKYNPSYPFDYYFQDDYLMPFEDGMNNIVPLLWMITFLGIFISLLGLFGLASYTSSQKTVEIGVRKAFGADTTEIIRKLMIQFARPVLIGIAIGMLVTYFLMQWVLSLFISPVPLYWWVFVSVGMGVIILSALTVLWQSVKAARRNPVESLNYE